MKVPKNDVCFLIMKLNIRSLVLILSFASFSFVIIILKFFPNLPFQKPVYNIHFNSKDIDCDINDEYSINCKLINEEVFIPFKFLRNYYEIYGKLLVYNSTHSQFKWLHSQNAGKVFKPREKYGAKKAFMFFENYNVEARDRVKCITAMDGVPLSTQWNIHGYYYPTQIAQFGLMHFSKNFYKNSFITSISNKEKILENAETVNANWQKTGHARIERIFDDTTHNHVLKFTSNSEIYFDLSSIFQKLHYFVLNFDLFLKSENSRLTVILTDSETNSRFTLNYINNNDTFIISEYDVFYGIGREAKWKSFSRDLFIDLQKGSQFFIPSIRINKQNLTLKSVILFGIGSIDNLTISQNVNHHLNFINAADWFVKNQNPQTGGWPNPVKKRFSNVFKELRPGWYSAMAQGHALSLLARAYVYSNNNTKYSKAALSALKLFHIAAKDGGIVNWFLDKFIWFEEYPTVPSSFVLNGFIYSLIGLYDWKEVSGNTEASQLYKMGLESLKQLLPFFDMGWRSSYDLRHFSNRKVPPNIARWDYHLTHVNQLLVLSTIDNDPIFQIFAIRWIQYMKGKVANHN